MARRTISMREEKIVISFPYDPGTISQVKEIPTAKYNPVSKDWIVDQSQLLSVINSFPGYAKSDDVVKLINEFKSKEKAAKEKAVDVLTNVNIDVIGKRTLYEHQKEAVKKILRERRIILSHDMGLGKTLSALAAGHLTSLPIYVIAPRSLHVTWQREAKEAGVELKHILSWAKIPDPPNGEFFVILDEAHAMQSMYSNRTRRALNFCRDATYVVAITGTPMKNGKPANLFGILSAIKHPLSFAKRQYDIAYCDAHPTIYSKWDCSGASNLKKLYKETKDAILFRTKKECLDLPEKVRVLRGAEVTKEAAGLYETTFEHLRMEYQKKHHVGLTVQEKMAMFMQLRRAGSMAKTYEACKIAEELAEHKDKGVFFVFFVDTANTLAEELSKIGKTEVLTGEIPQKDRQAAIDNFQTGNSQFIVCTFGTGSLGITLTAASYVILVDRPWTPGDCAQAEDRCHRIGQLNTVTSIWIQCNKVDIRIDDLLISKQKNISEVLTGDPKQLDMGFDINEAIDKLFDEVFK